MRHGKDAGHLVGRDVELAAVDGLLADLTAARTGALLLVAGEPGIGKSSLLTETARRAEASGYRVFRAGCWDGPAPPYWPWTQVLRQLRACGQTVEAPAAAQLVGVVPTERELTDFDVFDAVGRSLTECATEQPVVVLLDDLQWADDASIRLLGFLRTTATAAPLLVVGAYRPHETGEWLESVASGAQHLALGGLDVDAVIRVMTDVAGPRPPDGLAVRVAERCGGNPFFVRELARLSFGSAEGWSESAGADVVPTGVRAVVRRRLDQLGGACRELLGLMAVAGSEIETAALGRAAQGLDIEELLGEAEQARIITRAGAVAGFTHDLYRDVVLADLPPAAVEAGHARLAVALRETMPGAPDLPIRLAGHFFAAGRAHAAEAVRYGVLAAREATARLGHEQACALYQQVLELVDEHGVELPDDLGDRFALELETAAATARAGHHEDARDRLRRVAASARTEERKDVLAEAALGTHALGTRTTSSAHSTLALLDEAAAVVPLTDPTRGSRVQAARARALSRIPGRQADAIDAARAATRLADESGDLAARFDALLAQHDLAWTQDGVPSPEGLDARLRLTQELVALTAGSGAGERDALAHQLRAAALLETGDASGITALTRHCDLAAALGTAHGRWWSLSRRAVLAALDGRVDDAVALAGDALRLGLLMGEPDVSGCHASLRGSLALLGDEVGEEPMALPEDDPMWGFRHVLWAAVALASGDLDSARTEVAHGLPSGSFPSLDALALGGWAWSVLGPPEECERLADLLAPWAGRHLVVGGCASYYGPADRVRGALALAVGRRAEAEELQAAAADAARRLGAPDWGRPVPHPRVSDRPGLARDGATWRLDFGGEVAHLPDAKGLQDLATLVANPGQDVHVLTLLGLPGPAHGADPVLDDRARAEFRARLARLDEALDDADRRGDAGGARALTAEREAVLAELTHATGLGGRARRLGDETERARKTVGSRLRDTLRRIESVHPALASHLRGTVTIGTYCRYQP